jgi:hypothetical protein
MWNGIDFKASVGDQHLLGLVDRVSWHFELSFETVATRAPHTVEPT